MNHRIVVATLAALLLALLGCNADSGNPPREDLGGSAGGSGGGGTAGEGSGGNSGAGGEGFGGSGGDAAGWLERSDLWTPVPGADRLGCEISVGTGLSDLLPALEFVPCGDGCERAVVPEAWRLSNVTVSTEKIGNADVPVMNGYQVLDDRGDRATIVHRVIRLDSGKTIAAVRTIAAIDSDRFIACSPGIPSEAATIADIVGSGPSKQMLEGVLNLETGAWAWAAPVPFEGFYRLCERARRSSPDQVVYYCDGGLWTKSLSADGSLIEIQGSDVVTAAASGSEIFWSTKSAQQSEIWLRGRDDSNTRLGSVQGQACAVHGGGSRVVGLSGTDLNGMGCYDLLGGAHFWTASSSGITEGPVLLDSGVGVTRLAADANYVAALVARRDAESGVASPMFAITRLSDWKTRALWELVDGRIPEPDAFAISGGTLAVGAGDGLNDAVTDVFKFSLDRLETLGDPWDSSH